MPQNIHLSITTPCTEHWDQMSPNHQGRFCASCQKTVVDFAQMTDQEVLNWLARHQGPTCGRLRQDQLQRPLIATPEKKPGPGRYWHYFIAVLLSSSEIAAQAQPAKPATSQQTQSNGDRRLHIANTLIGDTIMTPARKGPSDTFRGRLLDVGGNPVSFATIMYKEKQGVAADADGNFSIPIANLTGIHTVKISALGYEPTQLDISKFPQDGEIGIFPIVRMEPAVLGELVTVVHRRKKRPVADTLATIKDTLLTCLNPAKKALSVYPNPVSRGNAVTIAAKLPQPGTYSVQLFNMSGGLLESFPADREQLSGALSMNIPATLPPGTYIVTVSHPNLNRPYTQSIVVF